MPNCYICDQYQDECIIDPKTHKLRHCSTCEAVIQDLLDDYDRADERNKKGRYYAVDQEFDVVLDEFVADRIEIEIPHSHYLAEEDEPTY